MRRSALGISTGTEVVCSALVTTSQNGIQNFDYRVVAAEPTSHLGDLVASSISLMGSRLTRENEPPTSVAVAYRDPAQAQLVRSATARKHNPHLVPESTAALTYLRHTGLLAQYDTVLLVDLGATGTTVTRAELADATVSATARTLEVSGRGIDRVLYRVLLGHHQNQRGPRPKRATLLHRARTAKEHLSHASAVTMDHVAGRPLELTRGEFEELLEPTLAELVRFVGEIYANAEHPPGAIALIGGGAHIPAVRARLDREFAVPVVTVSDPDAVIAKGAALIADAIRPAAGRAAAPAEGSTRTVTKMVGILTGAVVAVGLVLGYGFNTLIPGPENNVSPVGSTDGASVTPRVSAHSPSPTPEQTPSPALPPETTTPSYSGTTNGQQPTTAGRPWHRPYSTTTPTTSSSTTTPTTTTPTPTSSDPRPTLRPDPNLPRIPFPELPPELQSLLPPPPPAPTPTPTPSPGPNSPAPTPADSPTSVPPPANPPLDPPGLLGNLLAPH